MLCIVGKVCGKFWMVGGTAQRSNEGAKENADECRIQLLDMFTCSRI